MLPEPKEVLAVCEIVATQWRFVSARSLARRTPLQLPDAPGAYLDGLMTMFKKKGVQARPVSHQGDSFQLPAWRPPVLSDL